MRSYTKQPNVYEILHYTLMTLEIIIYYVKVFTLVYTFLYIPPIEKHNYDDYCEWR